MKNEEKVVLGKDCIFSTNCKLTGINNNRIIVGGTGTGKTRSLLEPELLETLKAHGQSNRIVVCTKRRLIDNYKDIFAETGYTVYDLNFSNPLQSNCTYDPVFYLRNSEDLLELSRAIVMANDKKETTTAADPYWDDAAQSLLSAEIALAMETADEPSLSDALDYNDNLEIQESGSGIATSLDCLFDTLHTLKPDSLAMSCFKTFCEAAPKTARSIYVSLNATLKCFTPDIRKAMKTLPKIDFQKFASEKSIIFVTTSPVKKSLHCLANMFVASAISELFEVAENNVSGELTRPVHISFDDFATGARIADFPEKISIFREKRISCSLLLQSEAQLQKIYGHFGAQEILDCCDSYIYLGSNNVETAKSISLRLDAPLASILYMPVGQEIIFRRGSKPIITTRYDIENDELYKEIARTRYTNNERINIK